MTDLRRVLVVEDEDTVGQIVTDTPMDEGYEVRRARNGREALALLGDWLPSIIVLDLMMPVMDGWRFRAEQRRLGDQISAVPVIVLSGAHDARTRAAELGAVAAIAKPFDLDEVVATVSRYI
jgi:DNA-binding response OmpR family regulator